MQPEQILLVSPDKTARRVAASVLNTAGYSCVQVTSTTRAVSLLRSSERFALVLADGTEDSLASFPQLATHEHSTFDSPIVVATTSDTSIGMAAVRCGAHSFLFEPILREELLAVVYRSLEYRALQIENHFLQARLQHFGQHVGPESLKATSRILIVDDEELIREIVASMLGTAGYACK